MLFILIVVVMAYVWMAGLCSIPSLFQNALQCSPLINDCMYRNMYRFRRIVVIDFDEFILPLVHTTLADLVDHLDRNHSKLAKPPANYAFRNQYFFLDLPPDDDVPSHLTLLRHRRKAPISGTGYSVKSIIRPQACLAMHNHYCLVLTAGFSKNSVEISPDVAVNQHYKWCHFDNKTCTELLAMSRRDETMLRFKAALKPRVAKKLSVITQDPTASGTIDCSMNSCWLPKIV